MGAGASNLSTVLKDLQDSPQEEINDFVERLSDYITNIIIEFLEKKNINGIYNLSDNMPATSESLYLETFMDKKKIFNWSITVALAGFLFGFDTVVISGANLPIKELWNTSPIFHGVFIMSMALWGTVLGSFFGSIPCDKIGRKNTLIWIGVLFFTSAIGSALAQDPYSFSFFRLVIISSYLSDKSFNSFSF